MPGTIIALSLWALVAALLFSRRLQSSRNWQATVTPLAWIIGSGFLVSVPLLVRETGNWAVFAMLSLVAVAYLVGAADGIGPQVGAGHGCSQIGGDLHLFEAPGPELSGPEHAVEEGDHARAHQLRGHAQAADLVGADHRVGAGRLQLGHGALLHRAGDRLHILNLGGVVGECVSRNTDVGAPLQVEVLGMAVRNGKALNIRDGSTGTTVRNNVLYSDHSFRGAMSVCAACLSGFDSDHNALEDRFTLDD